MAQVQATSKGWGLQRLAILVAITAGLYFAKEICIPFALAILFSFLLSPLVTRLQRWKIGRVPAVLIVVLLMLVAFISVGWVVLGQFIQLADQLPQYQQTFHNKMEGLHAKPGSTFDRLNRTFDLYASEVESIATPPATSTAPADSQPAFIGERALTTEPAVATSQPALTAPAAQTAPIVVKLAQPRVSGFDILRTMALRAFGPVAGLGLVMVLTLFMLIQREDVRDRALRLAGRGQLNVSTKAIDDAASRVSRYLLMQLVVNTAFGILTATGLYFIGVPNAPLWGLLAGGLRFMPYFGVPAAAVPPMVLAFLSSPGFAGVLLTLGLYVTLEILIAYFVEPWLYGSRTGISPLAILGSAIFWGWIWGPTGLLLSTPLTVCLSAIGKYVPRMEFLNVILGDEPALPPEVRFYQRLLAGDPDEAGGIVEQVFKEKSVVEVYDSILLPALTMAERDRHRGELSEENQVLVYRYIGELSDDVEDRILNTTSEGGAKIVCIPAHDAADELAARMIAALLRQGGERVNVLSVESLASEYVKMIGEMQPDVVCISAVPPQALLHTRYLCKLLRGTYPNLKIVAGVWGSPEEKTVIDSRLPNTMADAVATNLTEGLARLTSLAALRASPAPEKNGAVRATA